jgi:DNA-binding NarL/FixJ family response regulator
MSPTAATRTAVVVDQHPMWLETVEQVLHRTGIEVVAKLTSSEVADARLGELQPDLLVTGIRMPADEIDGIELLRRGRERQPGLKVLVLSGYDDEQHIDAAFAAGAHAYVLKTAHPDDVASAVRQAFRHSIYLASARPAPAPEPESNAPAALTRRETEILRLVAEGHSNAQLARMLWVTEQTVKFHLSNIYRKLHVSNRTEASRWAQVQGVLAPPALENAS